MVMGGCGGLWMVVGSCGWLWVVASSCGWLWRVAYFSITCFVFLSKSTFVSVLTSKVQ